MWEPVFQKLFREQYEQFLKSSGRKSAVRRFADSIDLSPSATSEILSGRPNWRLSTARARRIIEKFQMPSDSRMRLLNMLECPVKNEWEPLPAIDQKLLTDWTYIAVLFSHELPVDQRAPENIAQRLQVNVDDVNKVIRDLLARGLLEAGEDGNIHRIQKTWMTSDDVSDKVIKEHHQSNLELAKAALEKVPVSERDFTSLTFVGSPDELASVKKQIRQLYDFVLALMDNSKGCSRVYRMSVQLFPIDTDEGSSP